MSKVINWDDLYDGKELLMKNNSAVSPEATYECKVIKMYPTYALMEVCPIQETMKYETFLGQKPLSYRMCLSKGAIGDTATIYERGICDDEKTEKRAS